MSEPVDQPSAVTADYVVVSPEVRLYYEIWCSPAVTSGESLKMIMIMGELYASRWIEEYDPWWAFGNAETCDCESSAAGSHYLTDDGVRLLRSAKIPMTVQIASEEATATGDPVECPNSSIRSGSG